MVLSYEALAEQRSADSLLDEVIASGLGAAARPLRARRVIEGLLRRGASPSRPGPGPMPEPLLRALDLSISRRVEGLLPGDHRSALLGRGSELAQIRPYEPVEDDVRQIDWNVTARTGTPHVRIHLAERALVTWLVLDTSPSMTFGTAERRKADVAEGASLAIGYAATRRGNRLGLVTFGDGAAADAAGTAGPRRGCSGCCSRCARRRRRGTARAGERRDVDRRGAAARRQPGAPARLRRRRLRLPRHARLAPPLAHARRAPPRRRDRDPRSARAGAAEVRAAAPRRSRDRAASSRSTRRASGCAPVRRRGRARSAARWRPRSPRTGARHVVLDDGGRLAARPHAASCATPGAQ